MASRLVARRPIVALRDGAARARMDHLAAEEPMEMRVNGRAVAVIMRTPGDDFDLAIGFCLTEGIVSASSEIDAVRYCAGATSDAGNTYNVVDVAVRGGEPVDERLRRNVYTTSSCGVCGTASIEAVRKTAASVASDQTCVPAAVLAELPDRLRSAQRIFERTGGLHAAGVFTADSELVRAREDVGRHNAVDKVIGAAARAGELPLSERILLVSGRAAFEIVQKALIAGVPIVAAVSAPSSLAVSLAEEAGMTLVGFLRGASMNVYAGPERVQS